MVCRWYGAIRYDASSVRSGRVWYVGPTERCGSAWHVRLVGPTSGDLESALGLTAGCVTVRTQRLFVMVKVYFKCGILHIFGLV